MKLWVLRHGEAEGQARTDAERNLTEHAIGELVGVAASDFTLPASQQLIALPGIPSQLPSHLLQRRPDIAAAERRVFAANANIGVAKAAWYPDFSLTGLIGGQTQGVGNLLSAGNRYWALGPLMNLPIFDGGRLSANERQAKAEFEQASAQYRSQVLKAVREVEDNLAQLRDLQQEAQDEQAAADAALATKQGFASVRECLVALHNPRDEKDIDPQAPARRRLQGRRRHRSRHMRRSTRKWAVIFFLLL